ncbi:MAG: hypothetical protein PVG66_07495 [Chromatiales bacterium]|jgi:hypothetical protein
MKAQFAFCLILLSTSVTASLASPTQPVFLNIPSQFDGRHVTPARAIPTPSRQACQELLKQMQNTPGEYTYLSCSHRPIYSVGYYIGEGRQ